MANRHLDLQSFRTEKARIRIERDRSLLRVGEHWNVLRTPATRGILLRDAVGDVIGNWKPIKVIREVMNGHVSGALLSTVGSVYAASRPTWTKRALFGGINWAMGKVLGDQEETEEGTSLGLKAGLHATARSIGSALRRRRERRSS